MSTEPETRPMRPRRSVQEERVYSRIYTKFEVGDPEFHKDYVK